MPQLVCQYCIGDRVKIDGCDSIVARIVSVEWRWPNVVRYELSWMANGQAVFTMFDEWRLEKW